MKEGPDLAIDKDLVGQYCKANILPILEDAMAEWWAREEENMEKGR